MSTKTLETNQGRWTMRTDGATAVIDTAGDGFQYEWSCDMMLDSGKRHRERILRFANLMLHAPALQAAAHELFEAMGSPATDPDAFAARFVAALKDLRHAIDLAGRPVE